MQTTTVRLEKTIEEIDKIDKTIDRPRSWIIKEAVTIDIENNKKYSKTLE